MNNQRLQNAMSKLAGPIPGAFAFIFDGAEKRFICKSHSLPIHENAILELHRQEEFSDRLAELSDDHIQIDCDQNNRMFFLKKLATNVFIGLCVDKQPEILAQSRLAIHSHIAV